MRAEKNSNPAKWRAKWVTPNNLPEQPGIYFRARHAFNKIALIEGSTLHIAADSYYKVYINGKALGTGPARGTSTRIFYDSYELSKYIINGTNWIAVLACYHNIPNFKTAPAQPAILAQIDNGDSVASDQSWEVQVAKDWRADVRQYTMQMGLMEWRDFRLEPDGWTTGHDSSSWQSAKVLCAAKSFHRRALLPRDIQFLKENRSRAKSIQKLATVPALTSENRSSIQIAELISKELHQPCEDFSAESLQAFLNYQSRALKILPPPSNRGVAVLIDFDKEFNRGVSIEITVPEGCIVDIAYEEELNDERVDPAVVEGYFLADRYITKSGKQTLTTELFERGGRMVQLVFRDFNVPILIHKAEAIDARYPVNKVAEFDSSDPFLNKLWPTCIETIHCCAADTFIDCPWRESAFWVNDMIVENAIWMAAFNEPELSLRSLKLALSQANSNHKGLIPAVCPTNGKERLIFPATNLFLAIILEEYLLYSGDYSGAKDCYDQIADIVDTIAKWKNEDDILCLPEGDPYWNFVDWSFDLSGRSLSGKNATILSLFYILAEESLARLSETLRLGQSTCRRESAGNTMSGVLSRLWDSSSNCLVEWLSTTNEPAPTAGRLTHALAYLAQSCPEERQKHLIQQISDEEAAPPELYMFHFVFRALRKAGKPEEVLRDIERYWKPIIAADSPTIWEANVVQHGKAAFDGKGSLCHGFATTPVETMQRTILGITPIEPGYKVILFKPYLMDLAYATGSISTPKGPIQVKLNKQENHIAAVLKLPRGCSAIIDAIETVDEGTHQLKLALK